MTLAQLIESLPNTSWTLAQAIKVASTIYIMAQSPTGSTPLSSMRALIIGIDKYLHSVPEGVKRAGLSDADGMRNVTSIGGPNLTGAVADARRIETYLRTDLKLPEEQICLLVDDQATREKIIKELQNLARPSKIERDSPILIYYAGHGGSGNPPANWHYEQGETIECIIPHDFNMVNSTSENSTESRTDPNHTGAKTTSLISHAIPDRTLGFLLDNIAESHGDNITVILDCCHSASGTRGLPAKVLNIGEPDAVPRELLKEVPFPDDLDSKLEPGRARKVLPRAIRLGQGSHILLSACDSSEKSWELHGKGIFTDALLTALKEVPVNNPITYADLLDRIPHFMNRRIVQNPQCEGLQRDRYLFQKKRAMRGYAFKVQSDGTKYIMHAGEGHGITKGSQFTLRFYDEENLSEALLRTTSPSRVEAFHTELDVSHDNPLQLPSTGIAYQISVGEEEALRVYIESDQILDELRKQISGKSSPLPGSASMRITLTDKLEGAHIHIKCGQGNAVFELHILSGISCWEAMKVVHPVPITDLGAMAEVLQYAARFSWHLRRQHPTLDMTNNSQVKLSFTEVVQSMESGLETNPTFKPVGDNLISASDGAVRLQLDPNRDRFYGLKITNTSTLPMYVAAFLFDSDLSIRTYYLPPAAGTGKISQPPLRPHSESAQPGILTIGYGGAGFSPFYYRLRDGLDEELSFLRVFVSTKHMDLSFIEQKPSFEGVPRGEPNVEPIKDDQAVEQAIADERAHNKSRGGVTPPIVVKELPETWEAVTIPILQTRAAHGAGSMSVTPARVADESMDVTPSTAGAETIDVVMT
ncbi:hypothetical protein BDW22DRAFT_1430175 [Trametopsis cervina]|nr:hypothetical protein BDW22DRAFT_1430175 [Trametopsis cervina]